MINVENIRNSEINTDPWEHLVVDDILDPIVFDELSLTLSILSPQLEKIERNKDGWWPFELEAMGVDQKTIDMVMNINRKFLEISDIILEKFTNPSKSNVGYYSIPRMNYTPSYNSDKIHDDGDEPDKSVIIIIYFYPECSPGTKLYKTKSADSFVKEVTWKQNSALIISPKEGVTWHDFEAKDSGRITLNYYYEKLEYSDVVHKFNNEKLMWFYQAMSTNNFMIELKK
jgi:hypothetical protein